MLTTTDTKTTGQIWTDQDFMALPQDGHRYELVGGELRDMGSAGAKHGYVCSLILFTLMGYVLPRKLGVVFDSSTAFTMKNGNRRSPDISFFAIDRIQSIADIPTGFLGGSPDLAIEVLSPGNTVEEIDEKVAEYFDNSTRLVWIVSPTQRYVMVYHCAKEPEFLLKSSDFLDGEDVIPGFQVSVADFFQGL